jgi:hypothetical protein
VSAREWDMTSTHSLEAGAEYLRKKAGALLVVVVRVEDSAIACHPDVSPNDAMERLLLEAVELTKKLNEQRVAAREKAARRARRSESAERQAEQ